MLRKRQKIAIGFAVLLLVVLLAAFVLWIVDRRAWPEDFDGARMSPACSAENCPHAKWDEWNREAFATNVLHRFDAAFGGISNNHADVMVALRHFNAYGFGGGPEDGADAETNDVPRTAERTDDAGDATPYAALAEAMAENEEAFDLWHRTAETPFSLEPLRYDLLEADSLLYFQLLKIARFTPYRTAAALERGDWDAAISLWNDNLRIANGVVAHQGTLALFINLNITIETCRDILLAATERNIPFGVAPRIDAVLAAAERIPGADALRTNGGDDPALPQDSALLAEALRYDFAVASHALNRYLLVPRAKDMPYEEAARHLPTVAFRIATRLGSNAETSNRHLGTIAAHAVAAAEKPYSPLGLYADLPGWCRLNGRPPYMRDPLGAIASTLFVRNTISSSAYLPNRTAELRAARIAVALNRYGTLHPHTLPASLDNLLSATPYLRADALVDPFSPNGADFRYRAEDDGQWTLYSVGPDQMDNNGLQDWFDSEDGYETDLLYTSGERARRRRAMGKL